MEALLPFGGVASHSSKRTGRTPHPSGGRAMSARIRNWHKFQHYRKRNPPWIKLHRNLLDDKEWHELDGEAAKALIMLFLLASELDGELLPIATLAFRLRMSEPDAQSLISCWHDASTVACKMLRQRQRQRQRQKRLRASNLIFSRAE
jgi:hypothetical protein